MSQTAGHLLVIGRRRIIAAGPVKQVIDSVAGDTVRVRSPRAGELAAALAADGATVTSLEASTLEVSGTHGARRRGRLQLRAAAARAVPAPSQPCATGMIRSTFAAVPTRIPVLAAKALTLVVLTAAVTPLSVTLSYLVTMPHLSQHDLVPALDDRGTWRVLGGTLYALIAAALFSLGIGTLLRSTAASITSSPNPPAAAARHPQLHHPGRRPSSAASSALLTTGAADPQGADLSTQASLIVMAAYAIVPIVAAAVTLHRRDA